MVCYEKNPATIMKSHGGVDLLSMIIKVQNETQELYI
jgi:hypothetical protein